MMHAFIVCIKLLACVRCELDGLSLHHVSYKAILIFCFFLQISVLDVIFFSPLALKT